MAEQSVKNRVRKTRPVKKVVKKNPELEAKIRQRVKLEEKAFRVVENLIESGTVTKEELREASKFLHPNSYDDVVEERSISHQCGYPICGKPIISMTKQQYRISTKTNRVYDITDLKRYCSYDCFQASKFLVGQLSSEAVWVRDLEHFVLPQLYTNDDAERGAKLNLCAEAVVIQRDRDIIKEVRDVSMVPGTGRRPQPHTDQVANVQEEKKAVDPDDEDRRYHLSNPESGDESPVDPDRKTRKARVKRWDPENKDLVALVVQVLGDWLTAKTVSFLRGPRSSEPVTDFQRQYSRLCRRLDRLEVLQSDAIGDTVDVDQETEPSGKLPSYETLKNESLSIKEKDFRSQEFRLLPQVDQFEQVAIRRRMVINQLHQHLGRLLHCLDLTGYQIFPTLNELVKTFNLTNRNISLRPVIWELVDYAMLKMLSLTDAELHSRVHDPEVMKSLDHFMTVVSIDRLKLDEAIDNLLATR